MILLVLLLGVAGCPPPPEVEVVASPTPERTPVEQPEDALAPPDSPVALLDDGDWSGLRDGIDQSLSWLSAQPDSRTFVFGPRVLTARELRAAIVRFKTMLADDPLPAVLEERVRAAFDLLEATGGVDGTVLFTGYYEPVIEASLRRMPGYQVPIYGRPSDIIRIPLSKWGEQFEKEPTLSGRLEGKTVLPYWTREEIERGKLRGKRLEIAWAKDPVDLFFVEIQGSGTLALPNGKTRRIGYAGSNGRPYSSIGSLLIGEEEIPREAMSMQALRVWLAAHPEQRSRVLGHNESFVFFRFLSTAAVGALNRPVTPRRSIATDLKLFPRAAIGFVQTEYPRMVTGTSGEPEVEWSSLNRFVLNQDTGGAIRGAGRVDVFWGQGEEAILAAGMMKQPGRLFFLVPKVEAPSAAASP